MPQHLLNLTSAVEIEATVVGEAPFVTVEGVDADQPHGVKAALIIWGWHEASKRWAAGVCWVFSKCRGTPIQALLTMWVPAEHVRPFGREHYDQIARARLTGPIDRWPALPPIYPRIGTEWRDMHLHAPRPDTEGEYRDLRDRMRELRRRR